MLDLKFLRENPEVVKENIKRKFQDEKLPIVDEIYELDIKFRDAKAKGDNLRNEKNILSGEIGKLMKDKKIDEANEVKNKIKDISDEIERLTNEEEELNKIFYRYVIRDAERNTRPTDAAPPASL